MHLLPNMSALLRRCAVAIFAITLAGFAAARDAGDGAQRSDGPPPPARMMERLQQELGLSDTQRGPVQQILEQERAKHDAAHKEALQALSKVLTEDQLQMMERRVPRRSRGDRKPGALE